jgi:hypothetical protein
MVQRFAAGGSRSSTDQHDCDAEIEPIPGSLGSHRRQVQLLG